ncbi:MAG: molybdenum cofactor biosynthesis protein MoaE [Bacteroidota bacterium]|nr:molybdenum cofactor biosynthesis protein MoaE [Bacteroidota bacterium]MDP4232252.1 molybdenum cofactor biosynthesis protein MoaE [Bacteroidota bacterium]MDP4242654.1 molybdenum cofactor biosynthesis protein MoaE [Bacteroidota bacterium]MDP4286784.1 molybdenum cofactor biosynthesis protein MoaE [Bacteroidota bacterium]
MTKPYIDVVERAIEPPSTVTQAGAVVEFSGVVRDSEDAIRIEGIEYEAFRDMAIAELHRIAIELMEKYDLLELVCIHRVGFVPKHQAAVYVRTAATHRNEAYRANIECIDQLKRRVPIWKHPRLQ